MSKQPESYLDRLEKRIAKLEAEVKELKEDKV